MNKHEIYVGQTLILDNRKTGVLTVKVKKVNPKNVKVVTEDGVTWNCSPFFLSPAPLGVKFESKVSAGPALGLGVAVKFVSGGEPGLFVVVGNHGGLWRVARLGGDNGRYYSGLEASRFEVVNLNIEAGV